MATITLECFVNVSGGATSFRTVPAQNSASPLVITKGDSVNFIMRQEGSASGYQFYVYNFGQHSGLWTNAADSGLLSPNASFTKTTNSSYNAGASGVVSQLICDCYGPVSIYPFIYIKVVDPADTTPNAFSVGSDVTDAALSSRVAAQAFTLSGINSPVTATCTGYGTFRINSGSYVTSATVNNGDTIQLYLDSASTYSTSRSTTLSIGGITDTFSVTTSGPQSTGSTKTISCRVNYDQETQVTSVSFSPANSYENPLLVVKGDYVQFNVLQTGDATGYTFRIYGFDSGLWIDTSVSPYMNSGGSLTRLTDMSASPGGGYIDTLTFDAYGNPNRYTAFYLKIVESLDSTPTQFNVGGDISGVSPSSTIAGIPFTLAGINTTTNASCSANSRFTVNSNPATTSTTVKNGDKIQLFVDASSSWNSSVTGTLTIGGVSDSIVVTTVAQPSLNQLIDFPKTAVPVALTDVINFFGGTSLAYAPNRNLLSYLKGASYVPTIAKNSAVAAAAPISLASFVGSATALLFTTLPRSQNVSGNTISGLTSLSIVWAAGVGGTSGFDVGYGPGMKGAVEYRYVLTETTGGLLNTGILMNSNTNSPGTWSEDNTHLTLSQSHNNTERRYAGKITIQVRSKFNNAIIASASANYSFNFYGP